MAQDEERYQTKMQFFMNTFHELKTPLTLILLAAERLSGKGSPAKECKTILTNTKKILALITELVDIRKVDLGIGSLNLKCLSMSQMVARLFDEISSWAENKRLAASYTAKAEDIVLDAGEDRIGKMVINLLSNVIKYTNEGGQIEVSFKRGTMKDIVPCYETVHTGGSIPVEQPVCILTVKDTGVGIFAESIRLTYRRFFQARGISQSHLDSGIRFAITKSIVLQHKGVIVVSSERMTGTKFIVALPTFNWYTEAEGDVPDIEAFINEQYNELSADETRREETPKEQDTNSPQLPTLLLVKDNKELQAASKEQLLPFYNIRIADSERTGPEMCTFIFPDITTSDVIMSEMDGIEMCRRIKNNLSVAYIPLVLLTAKSNVESQIEGYESGVDLYIPKPFSMKLLEVDLQRLLAQREQWLKNSQSALHNESASNGRNIGGKTGKELQKSTLDPEELKAMMEQFKKVIDENLGDPDLSPEQVASAVGVSQAKLYWDLKRVDEQSLSNYVHNIRPEETTFLLVDTEPNVQGIMSEVGFANSSYFTRIFKLKYDIPPTEYKKSH